jgi:hypothetical protein
LWLLPLLPHADLYHFAPQAYEREGGGFLQRYLLP